MMEKQRLYVVGGGAYGTALALAMLRAERSVTLLLRDPAQAKDMRQTRQNSLYLPGMALPAGLDITADTACLEQAELIIAAIPAQHLRAGLNALANHIPPEVPVVIAAKGMEQTTGLFMSEVAAQVLPHNPPALLSGPSFAVDVARGLPTAVTLAAPTEIMARDIAAQLASNTFRLYHTSDLRGVEIGGSAKNVLAIASGIATGRNLGASACAALIVRGFAELARFGRAFNARHETLMGLSGLGDLILTCNSPQSRNFALGLKLGQGMDVAQALQGKLAEGAYTASALAAMARARQIDMPITFSVEAVLQGRMGIDGAIDALLARPGRAESSE